MSVMPVGMVLLQLAASTAPGGVFGTVRSSEDGRPIADVRVQLATGLPATQTDSVGHYRLTLPAGRQLLRFFVPGRLPVELVAIVPDAGAIEVDVDLVAHITRLAPLVVRGDRSIVTAYRSDTGDGHTAPGLARVEVPGQSDVQSTLADAPGAAARGAGAGTLHFQGGDADQYVVRLDGFPILAASHFAPASGAINPDLIRGIRIRSSAPPAREGEWLSGIVDLESSMLTDEGDRVQGAVNLTDVRQLARANLGAGARVLVSGRRSFRNVMGVDGAGQPPNQYEDLLGSVGLRAGDGWFQVLAFRNRNQFAFPSRTERMVESSGVGSDSIGVNLNGLAWWGSTVGARWTGKWRETAIEIGTWRAQTGSGLDWLSPGRPLHIESRFTQDAVRIDARMPASRGWLELGTAWIRDASSTAASLATSSAPPALQVSGATNRVAAYLEAGWVAGPWMRARMGVRATAIGTGERWVDPRIGIELHPNRVLQLNLAAGRVHQFSQSMRNQESFLGSFMGFEIPAAVGATGVPVASADNFTFSAAVQPLPRWTVVASGYARRFQGLLLVAPQTGSLFQPGMVGSGTGTATGAEVRATFVSPQFAFEGSFAVGSAERRLGNLAYRPGFQRSNSLMLRANSRLNEATTVGASLHASSGQRTTLIGPLDWQPYDRLTGEGEFLGTPDNLDALPNSRLLPGTLRLDIGVRRDWRISGRAGGRLITSVTIENLLDRANPVALSSLLGAGGVQPVSSGRRGLRFEVGWSF